VKRLAQLSLVLAAPVLAACSGTPAAKGTIPPGTPAPEYEPARGYTPEAATAAPSTPTAAPTAAPAAPAPAPTTTPQT
jgi:hypothetical protein